MQTDKKLAFNFFKELTQADVKTSSPFILRMWAMFLFTQYSIFKLITGIKKTTVLFLLGSVIAGFATTSYLGTRSIRLQENLVQSGINKQKETILQKQRIEFVKDFDEKKIQAIQTHLLITKEIEIKKIVNLYWTIVYIDKEEHALNMPRSTEDVQRQILKINNFYANRVIEVGESYNLIKKGSPDLIRLTHDNENPLEKIITWDNITKSSTFTFLHSTDQLITNWKKEVQNPVKLAQYLDTNKVLIDSRKVF